MYKKILVPLDGSELAECVLPHVEAIAKGCGVHNVIFVSVVEPVHFYGGGEWIESQDMDSTRGYLEHIASQTTYDGVNVQSQVLSGKAADTIADYATKSEVDLIIMSSHGRSGPSRWAHGSVADRVLRASCGPVLMVRAPGCIPNV